jgi:1,4-dihydroxy-2-naphthoate octaprenyltransferase
VLVGAGLAAHDHVFAIVPVLLAFFGSWLIHVAGVFTDNHELLRRHPQIREHPELSSALENRTLTLLQLKLAIGTCLALAALTAPYFIRTGGAVAVCIGIIGVVASLAYAGGPFPYARLGIAEPVFFVMFGMVAVVGTYYAQVVLAPGAGTAPLERWDAVPITAFIVGLPVGALVTNVLIIDDMRDREFDTAKGWRTIAARFGIAWSRTEYVFLSVLAYLVPFALWLAFGFSAWVLLPLLSLPWACTIGSTVCTRDRRDELVPMTRRASLLALGYSALMAMGIAAPELSVLTG